MTITLLIAFGLAALIAGVTAFFRVFRNRTADKAEGAAEQRQADADANKPILEDAEQRGDELSKLTPGELATRIRGIGVHDGKRH